MMQSSPILFALARTPGNEDPRTSGLLLWLACWLFTGNLCGCVAALAVGFVQCTAVLMGYPDVAVRWPVGHAELLLFVLSICFSIFSAQLFDFGNRLLIVYFFGT